WRIHYLVALARPDSIHLWRFRQRRLRYRRPESRPPTVNTAESIETVVIPGWGEDECPWCNELRTYRSYLAETDVPLPPMLAQRSTRLANDRISGLSERIFLNVPEQPELELTRGSILVEYPATQAEVFAAVASALQNLRTPAPTEDKAALGPRHFPVS